MLCLSKTASPVFCLFGKINVIVERVHVDIVAGEIDVFLQLLFGGRHNTLIEVFQFLHILEALAFIFCLLNELQLTVAHRVIYPTAKARGFTALMIKTMDVLKMVFSCLNLSA